MGKDFKDGGLWSTAVIPAPTSTSFRRKPESRGAAGRGMACFVLGEGRQHYNHLYDARSHSNTSRFGRDQTCCFQVGDEYRHEGFWGVGR